MMKKKYLEPEFYIMDVAVQVPISASGDTEEYPGGEIIGGGGTGDGGVTDADVRRRNSSYSRGASYVENNGGWSRGGLW